MGNVVGTLTWASRDKAFYAPPQPQLHYDEHAYSTSFVASTAGYNGDRESDYSVSTTGHVVCLVASPVFNLMPQRDTASQKTFPVGEVWTRAQLEPSLITGKEHLLVTIDTKSFEHAIREVLLILC